MHSDLASNAHKKIRIFTHVNTIIINEHHIYWR